MLVQAPLVARAQEAQTERVCHGLVNDFGRVRSVCISQDRFFADTCRAIGTFARHWALPEAFLARLIWQESRFDPQALSHAGAQGIAQFMPATARLRQLDDAFQPAAALAKSAEYLAYLADRFGNLGLAAAAYNGGEGRVSRWLGGQGGLPGETRNYVEIITGRSAEGWRQDDAEPLDYTLQEGVDFEAGCREMVKSRPMPELDRTPATWHPWGVLIAQNFSDATARSRFERVKSQHGQILGGEELMLLSVRNPSFGRRLRYSAQVGRDSRGEAETLCEALRRAGANCVVVKN